MIDRALIFGLAASIATLVVVLELVRQRRLKEEYSLLWLATGVILLILSLSRPLLDVLASAVGIVYPPSALFLVAVVFILFILLQYSAALTRLTRENKEMAQQMAILRYEVRALRQRTVTSTVPDGEDGDEQNQEQDGAVS